MDKDFITAKDAANILNAPYHVVLGLLSSGGGMGSVTAEKERGRWRIDIDSFEKFRTANDRKIKKIAKEYVTLYKQGLTVKRLKEKTRDDFITRGIVYGDITGFAEWTIYNYIMDSGKGGRARR